MKGFMSILNLLEDENVEYKIYYEVDQLRLVFPWVGGDDYIVVTRHEDFHVNNVSHVDGNQLDDFIRGLAVRQIVPIKN